MNLAVLAALLEDEEREEIGPLPTTGGVYDPAAEFV